MQTVIQAESRTTLYREIAEQIQRLISAGTFRPGERVPSVRTLSRQKDVSVTTVLEAYRVLEDSGLIEARPQSGYFVRPRLLRAVEEPERSSPQQIPLKVGNRDLMSMILRDTENSRLVQLGAAIPPPELVPTEKLNRALARMARRSRSNFGEPIAGAHELRTQIARRALAAGCDLTPRQIVTTNGCQEAIYFALRATCKPGDTVAVESPTFYGFLQAIELLKLRVIEIATYPRHGLCLDSLRRVLGRHAVQAVLLIPSFHNPLGSSMPNEKKEELVRILSRRNIPLIEDDIAGDLVHGPERPKAVKAYDTKGLVLLCSSFSKTLAPAYRIGWIAPGRFQEAIEHEKTVTNFATATIPQLAIADFLANGGYERHLRKMRRTLAANVALVTESVGSAFPQGTKVTRPAGGFVLWIELPKSVDALALYERARRSGVTFAPGQLFSAKGGYRNFIRLNAGGWSDRIRDAVVTLGRLASDEAKRR